MKRIILLLLLLPSLAWGSDLGQDYARMSPYILGGASAAASSCADSSCAGFILCQNFETATTGWDNSETWSTQGTPDPVDTTPALRGTQSCSLPNSSSIYHIVGGDLTSLYSFARFQFADASPSAATIIYNLLHVSADNGKVTLGTDGKLICTHGTKTNTAASALSDTTTYYIWFAFSANSGATDGVMTATVSTTRNKDEATAALGCSVTNGNDADAHVTIVKFANYTDGGAGVSIDQILVDDAVIGTVCE